MEASMINKNEKPLPGPGTVVGANVKLVGTLRDVNDIAVHGIIEGEVISERTITVGETAQIKGPVSGQVVSVAGVIRGSIDASTRLEILPTGKVYGNITARDLIIRSGALFIGKSVMAAEDEKIESTNTASEIKHEAKEATSSAKQSYEVE
jgi:cytoskeletal protein CcmA (bactofilin family)